MASSHGKPALPRGLKGHEKENIIEHTCAVAVGEDLPAGVWSWAEDRVTDIITAEALVVYLSSLSACQPPAGAFFWRSPMSSSAPGDGVSRQRA